MNMIEYVEKNKDKKLTSRNINDIDIMVLTQITYLGFDKTRFTEPEKIKNCISYKNKLESEVSKILYNDEIKLWKLVSESKRYKNIKIANSMKVIDEELNIKFSAMTFLIGHKIGVVAYRGTDGTLLGWRENITLGYLNKTPGQITALNYYREMSSKYKHRKFYISGHSKGGNLSFYTGLNLTKEETKRVIKNYNFDGPGFIDENLYKSETYEIMKDKMIKYVPKDSVVGIILNKDKYITVRSLEKGLYQHNLFKWEVENNSLIKTNRSNFSLEFESMISRWFDNIEDKDSLRDTIKILSDILKQPMNTKLDDLELHIKTLILKYLTYRKIERNKKKKVTDNILNLYKLFREYKKRNPQ